MSQLIKNKMNELVLNIKPTLKQGECWKKLRDNNTTFILFGGGAGGGKAQPLDSKILTPSGFINMGNVQLGTTILTPYNEHSKVIAISPQGLQDIYEITFIDGAKIKTTKEHLFDCWIARRGQSSRKVRSVKEIIGIKNNVIIPLSDKLIFGENTSLTIDPYLVGVLLGDGNTTRSEIVISTADEEILNLIDIGDCKIKKRSSKYAYSIVYNGRTKDGYGYNPLLDELRDLDMVGVHTKDKKIPSQILCGSLDKRLAVLQGLMDTDGTVDSRGHPSFCSISKQLAKDVQYVVRSIGGKATLSQKNKYCYYKGKKRNVIAYEVYIRTNNDKNLFRLSRKRKRTKKFNNCSFLGRRIIKIKKIGKQNAQCITIDKSHGLYISNDFIVTHNSWIGCEWLLMNCLAYAGTKWFIGRNELTRIMSSTYITFLKVLAWHKIPYKAVNLNAMYSYIQFFNGSRIDLTDCSYRPRDPLYERFGSIEYTGGWLEEAGEIKEKAFDVLKSRIGRQYNDKYNLLPKMFLTCNPKKNWTYVMFYRPWKLGKLPDDACFIQSLYTDNPYTAKTYGEVLGKIKDPVMRARLKNGEWEYDDDDSALMKYEKILEMFTRDHKFNPEEESYLSVDVARFGRDKSVFILWQGYYIKNIYYYNKNDTVFIEDKIKSLCEKHKIPIENVVVDSDGVGGGVVDHLPGVYAFVNGARAIEEFDDDKKYRTQDSVKFSYGNLRSQCYARLSEYVNEDIITCSSDIEPEIRDWIVQELECIKKKKIENNESKFQVIGKEDIKDTIGRSPDFSDALMMRMVFGLGQPRETSMDDDQGIGVAW